MIDAAVVAVPDGLRGEEILAYVYTAREDTTALADELWAFAGNQLARHKIPRYLAFRKDDFPRTPSMRVAKTELPRDAASASANDRERSSAVRQES